MDTLLALLAAVIALLVVVLAVRAVVSVVTVHDYERGLRYRNGRFRGLVPPGAHPVLRPLSEIQVIDARPAWQVLEGQEVPTADGVAVRVSLACHYVIGDPVAAFTAEQDYRRSLYLELQLALRDALAERTLEDALAARTAIGPQIAEACGTPLAALGIELLEVHVRDLVLPGELKRAFTGVIAARKEGEAALERARGETAALRSLANAGRLVEQSPGLLSLRVVQQLGQATGNSVIVSLPGAELARTPAATTATTRATRARPAVDTAGAGPET